MNEPMLTENTNRYSLFPIQHDDIWKLYKKMVACFWSVEEISFKGDKNDWNNKLTEDERYFIKMILAFFSVADGVVMDNIGTRFLSDVKWMELTCAYSIQLFIEAIHSETYALLIDTYISEDVEKMKLFNAIDNFPCIERKQQWAIKWIESSSSFAERLVAFACVEGIFFSGSFCAIFWLKKRGLMKGLTFSNELISRDEGMHTDLACMIYKKLVNKIPKETIYKIVREAVIIEKSFIIDALPCRLIGMNSTLMKQYIEFVADRIINQLGYKKIYKVLCPFDFMELIALEQKGNFFETKISSYSIDTNKKEDDNSNFDAVF